MSLREYVLNEITSGIIDVVHEVFLAFVSSYTAKDLLRFFKDDTDPWVMGYLEGQMKSSGALDLTLKIFRKYPDECLKRITVDEMIRQIEQHRPDLLPVIKTRQGRGWLTKRIDLLKAFIRGDLTQDPDGKWTVKSR